MVGTRVPLQSGSVLSKFFSKSYLTQRRKKDVSEIHISRRYSERKNFVVTSCNSLRLNRIQVCHYFLVFSSFVMFCLPLSLQSISAFVSFSSLRFFSLDKGIFHVPGSSSPKTGKVVAKASAIMGTLGFLSAIVCWKSLSRERWRWLPVWHKSLGSSEGFWSLEA